MDPITQQVTLASAGGKKDPLYVDDVFNTDLWAGNETNRSITNGIDLTEGGMVWLKARTIGHDHLIFDTERGANYRLKPNTEDSSASATNRLTAFNNDGFTLGTDSDINQNNQNVVSWTFRKAPGFFDVVTYNGSSGAQSIAHSLGSAPGMIIVKCTSHNSNWRVYHRSQGATKYAGLNSSYQFDSSSSLWNDTAPTSTHFTVNTSTTVNGSGRSFVAYIFAHDDASFGTGGNESIIKCGSFTGGGSLSNPKYTDIGFEPQFLLFKRTDSSSLGYWYVFDTMRGLANSNSNEPILYANDPGQESNGAAFWAHQNGFATSEDMSNGSFIYMAIRRPNKPPETATDVFAIDTKAGTSPTPPTYYSGFPVDWSLKRDHTATHNWQSRARLTGTEEMYTDLNNAGSAQASTTVTFDQMDGVGTNTGVDTASHNWMFKRAPGFMDVVTYTGTGSATTINHNLGVVPEMMWIKNRDDSESWSVYHKDKGADKNMWLNDDSAGIPNDRFNNTTPTASVFSVKTDNAVNSSGDDYIAYLFATLPGISKVGSYTGTGSALNIDCGFTNGARFVLIKRTSGSGDWLSLIHISEPTRPY